MTLEDYLLSKELKEIDQRKQYTQSEASDVPLDIPDKTRGLASTHINEDAPSTLNTVANIDYGNVYNKVDMQKALDNYLNKQKSNPLQAVNIGANLSKDLGVATVGVNGNAQLGTDNSIVGYNVRVPIFNNNSNINYKASTFRSGDNPSQHNNKIWLSSKDIADINGLAAKVARESFYLTGNPKEVRDSVDLEYSPIRNVSLFANMNKVKYDNETVDKGNQVGASYNINNKGNINITKTKQDSINGGKPQIGFSASYKF